jgi:hypothetical protein
MTSGTSNNSSFDEALGTTYQKWRDGNKKIYLKPSFWTYLDNKGNNQLLNLEQALVFASFARIPNIKIDMHEHYKHGPNPQELELEIADLPTFTVELTTHNRLDVKPLPWNLSVQMTFRAFNINGGTDLRDTEPISINGDTATLELVDDPHSTTGLPLLQPLSSVPKYKETIYIENNYHGSVSDVRVNILRNGATVKVIQFDRRMKAHLFSTAREYTAYVYPGGDKTRKNYQGTEPLSMLVGQLLMIFMDNGAVSGQLYTKVVDPLAYIEVPQIRVNKSRPV